MANEKTPVVWDDDTKKHRPLGTGEKMGGLDASSLLSSDSGNLLEAGSDGLAYLSGSGVVDPRADNLLEESDRGKLQVTIDRITEWLDGHPQDAAALADAMNAVSGDEGNLIVQGSDKGAFLSNAELAAAFAGLSDAQKAAIAEAVAEKMAARLADGKTIVASNGKLTSDPTNATAAQKKKINEALADADSGLVVDDSTGKLKVDFSNMPTDKFEELLKSLDMLVPLKAVLNLYVGLDGSDTIEDGRGTESKPFRTVQAALNYVTQTYSLGVYNVGINVKNGDYGPAEIHLPSYSSSSGRIVIRSVSGSRSSVRIGALILEHAVQYDVQHLTVTRQDIQRGNTGAIASYNGGVIELRDVAVDLSGVNQNQGNIHGIFAGSGGKVSWWAYGDSDPVGVVFIASADTAMSSWMHASSNGVISFAADITVQGTFSVTRAFAYATSFGLIDCNYSSLSNPGRTPYCTYTGATVTGVRYRGDNLSVISARGNTEEAAKEYYPGSSAGSVNGGSQFSYGNVIVG